MGMELPGVDARKPASHGPLLEEASPGYVFASHAIFAGVCCTRSLYLNTACVLLVTPSFLKILCIWFFTVKGLISSTVAMSMFVLPRDNKSRICSS